MLKNYYEQGRVEAGCDEAGRGCLAGSVYAAAVILPPDYHNERLNDSKKLTARQRYALRQDIERDAVAWAVGVVTPQEIDQINIVNASILAMHRALDQLQVRPEAVIVDGNRFKPYRDLPASTSPSPLPPSWPRPTATTRWSAWRRSIPTTTGSTTWATPHESTARPSASMASRPTTAAPSTSSAPRN